VAICVWCGFDKLQDGAEFCAVCGQTPESATVKLVDATTGAEIEDAPTVLHAPTPSPVDRIFADRYRIESTVGRGGMGSVFRVIDLKNGEQRALKVLHATSGQSRSALQRFEREAAMLRRIAHPAVPRIHDFGIAGDSMYLVTDFIDGTNLREAIASRGPFPLPEITTIGIAIADCLTLAHEHGIVHRDIKPHNVMLTRAGEVRLIDFGIARDAAFNATAITGSGFMIGTPQYMSPEQFEGSHVDARTDIYSLGVLLFELATGRLPFQGETPGSFALKHATETPPQPRQIRSDIPMLLNRVILKCLEKVPHDRYGTAEDLALDLRRAAEAKRKVQRTKLGDYVVDEQTGEEWALVIASPREKSDWSAGMTLLFGGNYFRLARIDYDTAYPSPYVYRFTFWPESEAIRKFVDYEQSQSPEPKSRLAKWLGRE
jgi:serine/threonine protein kinase